MSHEANMYVLSVPLVVVVIIKIVIVFSLRVCVLKSHFASFHRHHHHLSQRPGHPRFYRLCLTNWSRCVLCLHKENKCFGDQCTRTSVCVKQNIKLIAHKKCENFHYMELDNMRTRKGIKRTRNKSWQKIRRDETNIKCFKQNYKNKINIFKCQNNVSNAAFRPAKIETQQRGRIFRREMYI